MATLVGANGIGAPADLALSLQREIKEERRDVSNLGRQLEQKRAQLYKLQERFENAVKRLEKSESTLTKNRVSGTAGGDSGSGDGSLRRRKQDEGENEQKKREKMEEEEEEERKKWSELLPATGGWFVEVFLGRVNVRMGSKRERLKLKEEYELLKQKLAPAFVIMCIICLIFEENRWLHMLLQLGLSTYYLSLALRENILRANGSNIRSWWIIHHYLTIWQGVVLLTWPNGESYARWRTNLHYFGLYNALLQIFQTRYQIARLYTLRSLGKAGEMDVANSDSTQIHWSESMKFLLPLIALGQIMQAWQAVSLFLLYGEYPLELQILLVALLFCAMFSGNFITTAKVMLDKRRSLKARREAASRREQSQGTPAIDLKREKTA